MTLRETLTFIGLNSAVIAAAVWVLRDDPDAGKRPERLPVIAGPCMALDELPDFTVKGVTLGPMGKTYTLEFVNNRWMACPPQQGDLKGGAR